MHRYLRHRAAILWLFSLLAVATMLHFRGVNHPFVVFDDVSKIVNNRLITNPAKAPLADLLLTPTEGYIIPVTVLVQAGLWRVGDGQPWAFHLAGLLLHLLFVVLLFLLIRRAADNPHIAGAAALLFVAHPITVEPVAWATATKDLLAANLALGSTWLYLAASSNRLAPRGRLHVAALLLATLAMLSKPTVTLLGLCWLAYWVSARKRDEPQPSVALRSAILLCIIGVVIGAMSRFAHDTVLNVEREALSLGDGRVLLAFGHQLHHLMWPTSLHPMYLIDKGAGFTDWHSFLGLAGLAAFAVAVWTTRQRPWAVMGFTLAAAVYLPVSNLLPFPRIVADSYLYLPLAGLLVASTTMLSCASRTVQRGVIAAVVVISIPLGIKSWQQVNRWQGAQALWQPVIDASPDWDRGYGTLATAMLRREKFKEAARLYEAAFARGYRAKWLADFGVALARANRLLEAECLMLEAIHHGNSVHHALYNYAVLLGSRPERQLRFPAQAIALLPVIDQEVRTGRLKVSKRVRLGLLRRSRSLGPPTKTTWKSRTCDLLKAVARQ